MPNISSSEAGLGKVTAPIAEHRGDYFASLFEANDDPWQFRNRWYEQRKRALTLACLPHARYASAYEPGCANGELSAALAERCDRLLISDGAEAAVALAQRRVAALANVEVVRAWVPDDWPDQTFDLVVISEFGYYLGAEALTGLADRVLATLRPDGVVLACHWRRPIPGCDLTGDMVHATLAQRLGRPADAGVFVPMPAGTDRTAHAISVVDTDFRLDVWTADARSVAEREGLT